jgi:hypothetical protein
MARSSRFAGISLLGLACTLVLTGCFGSTTSSVDNSNLIAYEGSGFTMQVPKTWTAVGSKDLPKPKGGSVAGAFTSPEISSGFANNLLILRDTLADSTMTSRKYAVVNQALTTGEYLEYTKLAEAKVTFGDKDESIINTFEARYSKETPKQKFLQTSKVCGKNVYLLTIGLSLSNATTDKYAEIFKTFACK